jgi:hypothetical protein
MMHEGADFAEVMDALDEAHGGNLAREELEQQMFGMMKVRWAGISARINEHDARTGNYDSHVRRWAFVQSFK